MNNLEPEEKKPNPLSIMVMQYMMDEMDKWVNQIAVKFTKWVDTRDWFNSPN